MALTCQLFAELQAQAGTPVNLSLAFCVIAFSSVAWVYSIELFIRSRHTFREHNGLYFWSIQVSNVGIIIHTIAINARWFSGRVGMTYIIVFVSLTIIGWVMMVTGQSLVLYSRLHLLCSSKKRLRLVLAMIITNAIVMTSIVSPLILGSNISGRKPWRNGFNAMEKIQMTFFSIQECVISTLYIIETKRLLSHHDPSMIEPHRPRRLMRDLMLINVLIVVLDCGLLSTEYASMYVIESSLKPAIYALKLKVEFPILNALTNLIRDVSRHTTEASKSFGTQPTITNLSASGLRSQCSDKPPSLLDNPNLAVVDEETDEEALPHNFPRPPSYVARDLQTDAEVHSLSTSDPNKHIDECADTANLHEKAMKSAPEIPLARGGIDMRIEDRLAMERRGSDEEPIVGKALDRSFYDDGGDSSENSLSGGSDVSLDEKKMGAEKV